MIEKKCEKLKVIFGNFLRLIYFMYMYSIFILNLTNRIVFFWPWSGIAVVQAVKHPKKFGEIEEQIFLKRDRNCFSQVLRKKIVLGCGGISLRRTTSLGHFFHFSLFYLKF